MVQSLMSLEQLQTVSDLLWGADWALAHGDVGTLGDIASRLTPHVARPLQRDLQVIMDLARRSPDVAVHLWVSTRETLHCYLCDRAEGVEQPA